MSIVPLAPHEFALLRSVFQSHPSVTEVRLFGSRAKGTHQAHSDIDLAIWGPVSPQQAQAIAAELDDLPLPYSYDVQAFDSVKSPELRDHIERVGISIYPDSSPTAIETCLQDLIGGRINFWEIVASTSHQDLRTLMVLALRKSDGSYRKAAELLHIEKDNYRRFMDLLRRRGGLVDNRPFQKAMLAIKG